MRALALVKSGVVEVRDFPIPTLNSDQILVRMQYASICGSDIHVVFDGLHDVELLGKPGYPGHEGVGVVERSNSLQLPVGVPVLTVPYGQRGGCYAEYQAINADQVIPVGSNVDLRRIMMAQQLGTTIFAMKKFLPSITRSEDMPRTAVVIGAGSAGLFFLQHLLACGIEVIISDLDARRLEIAERLGAAQTVLEPNASVVDAARAATRGVGVDMVVEAAGYDVTREAAVEAACNRGRIGFFGFPQLRGLSPFPVERSFQKSLTMEWISGTQAEKGLASFREGINLIEGGAFEIDFCLESTFNLEDAPAAFTAARCRDAAKICINIISPDDTYRD